MPRDGVKQMIDDGRSPADAVSTAALGGSSGTKSEAEVAEDAKLIIEEISNSASLLFGDGAN